LIPKCGVARIFLFAMSQARFPGRVPHVRRARPGLPWGVHGPKKMGRSPFQRFRAGGEGPLLRASGVCMAEKGYLRD
jgi:hypothetical protein